MKDPALHNPWLNRFAVLTAVATLVLIGIGGLVTSHGVGMAVPDWPTSYGYNMFFFPISQWVGGIFYEHTHRLVASVVGLLVVGLTRWLGGRASRLPLAIIGGAEVVAGLGLLRLGTQWQGAGHFLSGIGVIVLLAGVVWARNQPAARPLPTLGWLVFATVQIQGLLGGLRVVLFKDQLGVFHAALAQLFFVMLCVIALFTSRWWQEFLADGANHLGSKTLSRALVVTTFLIMGQLILGATMRHQHAGLAIPDFPLAYGKIWPAMDPTSIEQYNRQRMELSALNPITPFQIVLQMIHRITALLIVVGVAICGWLARKNPNQENSLRRLTLVWIGLILTQALAGAAVIWSGKAADLATAHVVIGALSLALGSIISIISLEPAVFARRVASSSEPAKTMADPSFGRLPSAATGYK